MVWLLAACGAGLVLAGLHPFVTYAPSLAVLARLRPLPLAPQPAWRPGKIAVCVSAYNEEAHIAARVENLLEERAACPDLEILVYVDGATDGTLVALAPYRNRVRVISSSSRQGKSFGMNRLVAASSAELLVFTDANVRFAPGAVARLVAPFADDAVGCVCGHLRYASGGGNGAAEIGSAYWRLEERIKALEAETGSVMGADGSIFAIRRALHVPPPVDLIDDMYVSFQVLLQGYRVVRADDAVAWEPPVASSHEEVRRKIRIACQAMNVHRALWPALRRLPAVDLYKYVSHKLLRWVSAYLLAAGGACLLGAVAASGDVGLAAVLTTGSAGLLLGLILGGSGRLSALSNIVLALGATAVGVAQSFRGARFQVWTPPSTARAPAAALAQPSGEGGR